MEGAMKAYLVIVFLMPGHNRRRRCRWQPQKVVRPQAAEVKETGATPADQIVVQGVIIQSFCLDNK